MLKKFFAKLTPGQICNPTGRVFAGPHEDSADLLLDQSVLYAFYDLDMHPISYDVTYFVVACEIERKKRGLEKIHVVFVPMADMYAREVPENYDSVIDLQSRLWRLDSICTQIPRLMPSVSGITVCASRFEADLFRKLTPNQYPSLKGRQPHHADYFQLVLSELQNSRSDSWGLTCTTQAKRYVDAWLAPRSNGRKPIVITLRQYMVDPERNSNPTSWTAFAKNIDAEKYFPVFVPDTDHAHEYSNSAYSEFAVFEPAAWSVGLRMALYESAYLNMFVNTGPNSLAVLNSRCNYLFFKVLIPGVALTSEDFLRWLGFVPGQSPNFATPYQKWVWTDLDELPTLEREFKQMCKKIGDDWRGKNGN